MATENHYPEGQIWNADGTPIHIGGMSFNGAKTLQKILETTENDIIETLCNIEEVSIALYEHLAEAYDCDDVEIGQLLRLYIMARKHKAEGNIRHFDALNETISRKSKKKNTSPLIAELQSRL